MRNANVWIDVRQIYHEQNDTQGNWYSNKHDFSSVIVKLSDASFCTTNTLSILDKEGASRKWTYRQI